MNRVVRVAGMQAMHGPDNIGFTQQGESGFIVSDLLEKERKKLLSHYGTMLCNQLLG